MKILTIQEAYKRKFERQSKIEKLEFHASGHCVHLGKISPGCYSCFIPDKFRNNILTGVKCNLNCLYCFNKLETEEQKVDRIREKANWLADSRRPDYEPRAISFSGGGEPLLYIDVVNDWMNFFHEIARDTGKRPWYYLYTNGLLADKDMLRRLQELEFDEIRFHLGASNFAQNVYDNIAMAVRYFKVVAVETPAWPLHRRKLFEMLPIIDGIGVKHLNLGEIEITSYNYKNIAKLIPDAEIYPCFEMHLDDGGLTYDIIEEVVAKDYSFSVLDCSCFVKSYQRAPAKFVMHEEPMGLIDSH